MGKIFNKIDAFFEYFSPLASMVVGFVMIIIYTELVLPDLTWEEWIVTPVWIGTTLYLIWKLGYRNLFKDNSNKVKRRSK